MPRWYADTSAALKLVQEEAESYQDRISAFLATIDLYGVTNALFRQAGLLPGTSLRSLDALHLASAIALDVDAILTYDVRLGEAAEQAGMDVVAPR